MASHNAAKVFRTGIRQPPCAASGRGEGRRRLRSTVELCRHFVELASDRFGTVSEAAGSLEVFAVRIRSSSRRT